MLFVPRHGKSAVSNVLNIQGAILSYEKICGTLGLPTVVDLIANSDVDLISKLII